VLGACRRRAGFEVIAELAWVLFADLFRGWLAAMLRNPRVVVNAHLADVQLGAALGTFVQAPQRQAQMGQRSAAIPADQVVAQGTRSDCQTQEDLAHRQMLEGIPARPDGNPWQYDCWHASVAGGIGAAADGNGFWRRRHGARATAKVLRAGRAR